MTIRGGEEEGDIAYQLNDTRILEDKGDGGCKKARREMVKQLFILLDLVVLRYLAGRRQIRVRRRPIVELLRQPGGRGLE